MTGAITPYETNRAEGNKRLREFGASDFAIEGYVHPVEKKDSDLARERTRAGERSKDMRSLFDKMESLVKQVLPEDMEEVAGDEELRLAGARLMAKLRKPAVRSNGPEV